MMRFMGQAKKAKNPSALVNINKKTRFYGETFRLMGVYMPIIKSALAMKSDMIRHESGVVMELRTVREYVQTRTQRMKRERQAETRTVMFL